MSSDLNTKDFTWKHKVSLAGVGTVFGCLLLGVAWWALQPNRSGSEFSSLEDLRRAMLSPEAEHTSGSGSVPLGAIVTPHPDDQIIYDLRPNLEVLFQRVPVKTNSCGMRGVEISPAKDSNTYRIIMLGDSFTFGWGVEEEKIFARVLESNLNKKSQNGTNFQVLNLGVPGYSTFQEVAKFLDSYEDLEPDALLVYFISNDFGLPFYVKDLVEPSRGITPVNKFAALQQSKKHKQSAIKYQNELVVDPNIALRDLSNYAREQGIKLHVAINPRKGWRTNLDKLWILRKRKDINVIKLRRSFMEAYERMNIPESALTLKNDPHPSAIRHKLLGDLLTPHFMEHTYG